MSNSPNLEKLICSRCSAELDATDHFCRHCGAATGHGAAPLPLSDAVETVDTQVVTETPPAGRRLSDSRTFLLVMLFLVLGPLVFPMLWRSRAFTRGQKNVLTIVVIVLTVVVLWLTWYLWVHMIIEPFREFFAGY